jgi:alpha-D-ribose 1-methylphosphonate 5-triphosphate synthase subunit PhnG
MEFMNYYHIVANASEEQVARLADIVLSGYGHSQVRLLSGPRQGLVMLRVRETVANSLFNAGEILVTEVKLELGGQFGFGMIIGDSPRHALGIALVDAALRKGGELAQQLNVELVALEQEMHTRERREQALVAATKVDFERM